MPAGRPSKYDPKFCQEMIDFFTRDYEREEESTEESINLDEGKLGTKKKQAKKKTIKKVGSHLPTFVRFAANIGVVHSTLLEWVKNSEEFSKAYSHCKHLQEDLLIQNALSGKYAPGFSIFLAKNITSMRDNPEPEPEDVELIV